jgi:periplasmic divalent cation tolerance protein
MPTATDHFTPIRLLYVTTKDTEEARTIARTLLDRRLISCANILPAMMSIYRWDGEIQEEKEAVLILKTDKALVAAAQKAVIELHSYQTPCVLSIPIETGAPRYITWLLSEVGGVKEHTGQLE